MEEGTHEPKMVDVSDGGWVPRERLDHYVGQVSQLRAEVESLSKPKEQPVTISSYGELVNQVEAGEITQAEADELNALRTRNEVVTEVTDVIASSRIEEKNTAILENYVELVPDISEEGTDLHKRIVAEHQALLVLGHEVGTKTQVAAVRSVLGSPE